MHDDTEASDPIRPMASALRGSWRIKWRYASPIIVVHLIALLALLPWFFSWTGVALAVLGWYVFGTLGMCIGYHRLLTHRSFSCPRWVEHTLALLGVCCMEESPTVWVAWHRQHHSASDKERDPHSPRTSFLWGHIGWLVIKSDNADAGPLVARYGADLMRDPFYVWLKERENWMKVALLPWAVFFVVGFLAAFVAGGTMSDAIRFGSSLLVWGGAVRVAVFWHCTWSVNSATHRWGYRNYETNDGSRNNAVLALLTSGESWHNNHHADPASARYGHTWWELDLSWLTIRLLILLGLAGDVSLPSPTLSARRNSPMSTRG
jgi:stearoyl-CoA desaturase (delta-9 desaturase)